MRLLRFLILAILGGAIVREVNHITERDRPICPRCRNTGFYLDNDAEGFKGRTNKVRCGCPAGDPELDD